MASPKRGRGPLWRVGKPMERAGRPEASPLGRLGRVSLFASPHEKFVYAWTGVVVIMGNIATRPAGPATARRRATRRGTLVQTSDARKPSQPLPSPLMTLPQDDARLGGGNGSRTARTPRPADESPNDGRTVARSILGGWPLTRRGGVRTGRLVLVACLAALTSSGTLLSPGNLAAQAPAAGDGPDADAAAVRPDPATDAPASAEGDPGQADLDEAVVKRIDAESRADLETVAALIESALAKGLADENASFAKKMLGSVQLQLGQEFASEIPRARGRRQLQLLEQALTMLRRATENDPTQVEAYLLIARLNLLPNGDQDEIRDVTTKAIGLLEDDPEQRSKLLVLRALVRETDAEKLADLDAALEADPTNGEALQARAAVRMQAGDVDGAVKDLQNVLARDPSNQAIAQAAVQQLVELNRAGDALDLLSKTIEAKPSEALYRLRAILYRMEGKEDEALADLNKALAMQPKDPVALLQRAEIAIFGGDIRGAKRDLKAASEIAPQIANATQAIYVRCLIANEEGRTADAINDMKTLVSREPDNLARRFQLANLYQVDERPRKAIETLTQILEIDPGNSLALRSRGDALLAVGDHAAAIMDYEATIASLGDDDTRELYGVLNNLAWVLATSPRDEIRDGQRSLELGEKAARLSEYSEPHILSTLAACYAETGDFENAIRWAEKAVELGRAEEHGQIEQLEAELESYRKNEPWREIQETEENKVPILDPADLIET